MPPEIKASYNPANAAGIQYHRETRQIKTLPDLENLLTDVDREIFYTKIVVTDEAGKPQVFQIKRKT